MFKPGRLQLGYQVHAMVIPNHHLLGIPLAKKRAKCCQDMPTRLAYKLFGRNEMPRNSKCCQNALLDLANHRLQPLGHSSFYISNNAKKNLKKFSSRRTLYFWNVSCQTAKRMLRDFEKEVEGKTAISSARME
jgi:hypothetical protein